MSRPDENASPISKGLEDRESLFVRVEIAVNSCPGAFLDCFDEGLEIDEALVLLHIQLHPQRPVPSA